MLITLKAVCSKSLNDENCALSVQLRILQIGYHLWFIVSVTAINLRLFFLFSFHAFEGFDFCRVQIVNFCYLLTFFFTS